MCYHSSSATKSSLAYAKHRGDDPELIKQLEIDFDRIRREPMFHASGYSHPKIFVFTNDKPFTPQLFNWGMIASWCKDEASAKKSMQQTLNARGETIFQLASFRNPAKNKRCVVYLDAFFEFHHLNKKTFPFRISMKDDSPMAVAGLWEEWINPVSKEAINTFSIVTTSANETMTRIHNNSKSELGGRMPVILPRESQDAWLDVAATREEVEALIKPLDDQFFEYRSVGKFLGKEAIGNKPEVANEVRYEELSWT